MWPTILLALGLVAGQEDPDLAFLCGRVSYALLPNASDCGRFIFCNDGAPLKFECHPGEIWSQEEAACVLGDRASCTLWEPTQACVGLADGPIEYPRECGRFINCVGGSAEVVDCPAGLIYLPGGTECVVGALRRCESLEDLCEENTDEIYVHPEYCGAFIECDGNKTRLEFCPADEIFSLDIKFCVPGDSEKCEPQPVETVCEGRADGLLAHPMDCGAYISCENSSSTVERCRKGEIFVPQDLVCVVGDDENCRLLQNVCDGQISGRIIEHPNYCEVFIECYEDKPSIGFCTSGHILRPDMQVCVPGSAESCDFVPLEEMCFDRPFGVVFPHPDDCSKLVRCEINSTVEISCPQNHVVESGSLDCVPGDPDSCQSFDELCVGKDDETISLPNKCDFIIRCLHEQSIVVFCPPGEIFDTIQRICLPGTVEKCELLNCVDEEDGFLRHPELCSVFVHCESEQISVHPCLPGHIFHPLMRVCTPGDPTSCELDPIDQMCESRFNDTRYPYPTEKQCIDYVVCNNEEAEVQSCPDATVLRPQQLDCIPGNVETCEYFDNICSVDHEEIHPHPARCDVRIVCIAGEPNLQFCPEGEIVDPDSLNCIPGDVSECLPTERGV